MLNDAAFIFLFWLMLDAGSLRRKGGSKDHKIMLIARLTNAFCIGYNVETLVTLADS